MEPAHTVPEAKVSDLYNVRGKAELINGNLVRLPPTGGLPSRASMKILLSLYAHCQETGVGEAVPDNTGFLVNLPNRRSFSPDVAYWNGGAPTMKFYAGAPVFAVDVRSEHDYGSAAESDLASKRTDYFSAGTLIVWDVDLLNTNVIRSYNSNTPELPLIFSRNQLAHAEPAVPGWQFPVNELF